MATTRRESFKSTRGRFRKGHDPRRHKFTREECQRGFWGAITAIITQHPNAIDKSGRHIACNFLRSKENRTSQK